MPPITSPSNPVNAQATQAAPAVHTGPQFLDHSLAGMIMGLYCYWSQMAEGRIDSATAEVDAHIDVAKLRGELLSKITQLKALLDKPTTRPRDLKGDNAPRANQLCQEINELGVRLGYFQVLDTAGNPVARPPSADPGTTSPLFGNTGNRVPRPPTDAQLAQAYIAARAAAWADLKNRASSTATDKATTTLQTHIARTVNGLEAQGIDMITGSEMPVVADSGRWFASTAHVNRPEGLKESWSLYPDALEGQKDALSAQSRDMSASVNYVMTIYNQSYVAHYGKPNNGYVVNGADDLTDGAKVNGAEVLVQNQCTIDNQNVNKSMNRVSNLVQEKNSFESGANQVLQLSMKTLRTLIGAG